MEELVPKLEAVGRDAPSDDGVTGDGDGSSGDVGDADVAGALRSQAEDEDEQLF